MIRVVRRLLAVVLSVWAVALLAYYLDWFGPGTHQTLRVGLDQVNGWAIGRLGWAVDWGGKHINATVDELGKTLHEDLLAGLRKLGDLFLPIVTSCLALYFYVKLRITRRAVRRLLKG
jgi:hypothetical protein